MTMDSKYLRLQECYKYLNCDVFSRCSNEGEAIILNANHINAWGKVGTAHGDTIKTLALCLKTSELKDVPHEINGTFHIVPNQAKIEVAEMRCSCKAGKSEKCKHIAAFLLLCTRNSILEFEEFSCTDIKCYWKLKKESALEQYTPKPLKEWSCINEKSSNGEPEIDSDFLKAFIKERIPSSALGLHSVGRREIVEPDAGGSQINKFEVPRELQEIANCAFESQFLCTLDIDVAKFNLKVCCQNVLGRLTNVDVIDTAIKTKQQVERWRCERQYRLTGARSYAIFTYSKDNWEKKAHAHFWPTPFSNKYVQHGIRYEKEALLSYKTKNGYNTYEPGFIICQKYPWLGYTPDAVVLDSNGKPNKLIEIKCPYIGIQEPAINFVHSCKFLKLTPTGLFLKEKHQYYGQVQLGMAILNIKETNLILYSSSSQTFLNIVVPFDELFARKMITKITENYFNYMLHFVCGKENADTYL